jgi:hypothetical protein
MLNQLRESCPISRHFQTYPKGRVIIDISYPDQSMYPVEDHSNRVKFYPDSSEEIPKDLPLEKDQGSG